ncbi:MAG: STAS domain-containing protein [Candidatus Omnitrophota bacterium]
MLEKFFRKKLGCTPACIKEIHDVGNVHVVRLKGPIDMETIPEIKKLSREISEEAGLVDKNIMVNFGEVTHIDSATCAILVRAMARLKQEHHKLILVKVSKELRSVLAVSRLNDMFEIYETEEKGLEALGPEQRKKEEE